MEKIPNTVEELYTAMNYLTSPVPFISKTSFEIFNDKVWIHYTYMLGILVNDIKHISTENKSREYWEDKGEPQPKIQIQDFKITKVFKGSSQQAEKLLVQEFYKVFKQHIESRKNTVQILWRVLPEFINGTEILGFDTEQLGKLDKSLEVLKGYSLRMRFSLEDGSIVPYSVPEGGHLHWVPTGE